MGKYKKRFGDRRCEIRIAQRGNVLTVEAHVHGASDPYPETDENFPDAPNERAHLDHICRHLAEQYGPEQEEPLASATQGN